MNALERAAQLIEERGWCRHRFHDEDGRVCLDFALLYAGRAGSDLARACVQRELAARGVRATIVEWNDTTAAGPEAVLEVLRAAAARWPAAGAELGAPRRLALRRLRWRLGRGRTPTVAALEGEQQVAHVGGRVEPVAARRRDARDPPPPGPLADRALRHLEQPGHLPGAQEASAQPGRHTPRAEQLGQQLVTTLRHDPI